MIITDDIKKLSFGLLMSVILGAALFCRSIPVQGQVYSAPRFYINCTSSGSESGMVNYGIEEIQVRNAIAEEIQKKGGLVVKTKQEADYEAIFAFEAEFGLVRWKVAMLDLKAGGKKLDLEGQKEVSGMITDAVQAMTNIAISVARETVDDFFEKNRLLASGKSAGKSIKTAPAETPSTSPVAVASPKPATPQPVVVSTPKPTAPPPTVVVATPKPAPTPAPVVIAPPVQTPPPSPVAMASSRPALPSATPPIAATPRPTPRPASTPLPTPKTFIPPTPAPQAPSETEGEPPQIEMTYPNEDETHTTEKTITLAGVIKDPDGIENYTISANGKQVFPPPNTRNVILKAKGIPISTQVDLKMGENVIIISATDKKGNPSQNFIKVYRETSMAVGGESKSQSSSPSGPRTKFSLWAVVIGINNFQDKDIPPLKYAVPDAQGFKNYLESQKETGLYKSVNIKYLTNKDATLQNIKAALGEFLVDARGDDIVYIFIAGHGMVDAQGDSYILTYDARAKNLYSTALPMEEFKKLLKDRIYAERTIVIADACHSGGIGTNMRGARDLSMDEFRKFLETSKGRAILTASRARELSQEDPKLGHGLFTYYLLQGLKGKADANGDGVITLNELNDYLYMQVVKASGSSQHPELKGEFDNTIPIGIINK